MPADIAGQDLFCAPIKSFRLLGAILIARDVDQEIRAQNFQRDSNQRSDSTLAHEMCPGTLASRLTRQFLFRNPKKGNKKIKYDAVCG